MVPKPTVGVGVRVGAWALSAIFGIFDPGESELAATDTISKAVYRQSSEIMPSITAIFFIAWTSSLVVKD